MSKHIDTSEKPALAETRKFAADDFTRRHLTDWFQRGQAPSESQYDDAAHARMIAWLESQEVSEAEYAMGQGWTHVYFRSLEAAK